MKICLPKRQRVRSLVAVLNVLVEVLGVPAAAALGMVEGRWARLLNPCRVDFKVVGGHVPAAPREGPRRLSAKAGKQHRRDQPQAALELAATQLLT